MTQDPILLVGGAGLVGRWAARFLRLAHPETPILIGGRDAAKAEKAAAEIGRARGVVVDLAAFDLGLADQPVSAVATLFTDETSAVLRWAQRMGAGHVSISPGIAELGPEVAAFMRAPTSAPVVLGTEWMVGATSMATLILAEAFARIDEVRLGALLDERDDFGPAATADLERQTKTSPAALRLRDGAWRWRTGADAVSSFRAADGAKVEAAAFSPNDVLALATATGARDVVFDLAVGESSTRRAGGPPSTEIVIELAGSDRAGSPLRTRHVLVHPGGQMPLTGFGVSLILERLAGLGGPPPVAGLYFPSQLIDRSTFLYRLAAAGGRVTALPVEAA